MATTETTPSRSTSIFDDVIRLPKVEVYVTQFCNNRCNYCDTGWENAERSRGELAHVPRAQIRDHLREHYARGARRVVFAGGEPTVRRDLGDLVEDARNEGYEATTVFTNARAAASPAGLRWLASMGVTWFQVSIQGGTAEAHDASVVAPRAFEQTMSGAKRLLASGQRVKVNGVLTVHLLDSLAPFVDRMLELRPEEVGLDVVRPSPAFGPGRADYRALLPKLSTYSAALADALRRLNSAGVVARVVSCPPCLVPGAEEFVSEEQQTSVAQTPAGKFIEKLEQRRSLQEKPATCGACAYEPVCPGLFAEYAAHWGTDELKPLARRRVLSASGVLGNGATLPDSDITLALRRWFASTWSREHSVASIDRTSNDTHLLRCRGPRGEVDVELTTRTGSPAYARTQRFGVSYRGAISSAIDTVDCVVATLRAHEGALAHDEPSTSR